MKRNTSIRLKAAFLLVVFALNSVVGFACSMGIDMGFNSTYHHEKEDTEPLVHVHKDGNRHVHQENKGAHHAASHHNDEADNHKKTGSDKNNCCNDKVTKFQQLDKAVPQPVSVIHPVFFTSFIATWYNIRIQALSDIAKDMRQFVRSYHLPIPDIRIAIQSFLI